MNDRPISIANRHARLRLSRTAIERAVRLLDAKFATPAAGRSRQRWRTCPPGELSLVFVTDAELARLHDQFLQDPSITDVITFAGDLALGSAGEVCVSADAARRQLVASGVRQPRKVGRDRRTRHRELESSRRPDPAAFSAEVTLYLVHGWLHLAGYDDLQPAKKRVMRRAEARAMKLLQQHGAVPAFTLR